MTSFPALVGLACVAALGCHHARSEHVAAAYFGTKVVPPGVLAKIRPGMTLAEVTAVAPGLREVPLRGYLVADADGAKQYVVMADGIVVETYVALEGDDVTPLITAAWGAPNPVPKRSGTGVWRGVDTGWRASLDCGHGSKRMPVAPACKLTFLPYRPAAELFTKAIGPGGVLAAIKPDATFADAVAATHLPLSDYRQFERTSEFDGARETVSFVGGASSITYFFDSKDARSALDAAWGPPTLHDDTYETWLDPNTGWRADCSCKTDMFITFSSYWPFAKVLATLEAVVASADLATARRTHPELKWDADGKGFSIPDTHGATKRVDLHTDDKHVTASLWLFVHQDGDRDRTLTELASRWGSPKKTTARDRVTYVYPKYGTLRVDEHLMILDVK